MTSTGMRDLILICMSGKAAHIEYKPEGAGWVIVLEEQLEEAPEAWYGAQRIEDALGACVEGIVKSLSET